MESIADFLNFRMPAGVIVLRVAAAILCGAAIGYERERKRKPAGLRTHILVCLGTAAYMLLSLELTAGSAGGPDILRTVQGIAQGIGFLGAGAIIEGRDKVRGITTAAGIWTAGAIGLACGAGLIGLAALVTVLTLTVHWLVLSAEVKLEGGGKEASGVAPESKPE